MSPDLRRDQPGDPARSGGRRGIARVIAGMALCVALAAFGLLPAWAQTAPSGAPQQKGPGAPPEGRDPFRPLIQKKGAGLSKEEVALGRLKLVGILWDRDRQARALIETEDGLGYILREKDSIMGGQVVEITSQSVKFAIREEQGRSRIVSIPLYPN